MGQAKFEFASPTVCSSVDRARFWLGARGFKRRLEDTLGNGPNTPPRCGGVQLALEALEAQLHELDRLGTHKAAAHLDAAIQQLKRDRTDLSHHVAPIPLRAKVPG
ncbi:MAG: hypothetical protein AAGH57_07185 [Pseudomonadota bacterium]